MPVTPRGLVRAVAAAFRVEESSVAHLDRKVAEHGLRRSTGGRGSAAPRMSASDAAALMLMVLAHAPGANLDLTIKIVDDLWRAPLGSRTGDLNIAFLDLQPQTSFGEALAVLIDAADQLEIWL